LLEGFWILPLTDYKEFEAVSIVNHISPLHGEIFAEDFLFDNPNADLVFRNSR